MGLGVLLVFLLTILVVVVVIISQPPKAKQEVKAQDQPQAGKGPDQGPAPEPRFSDAPLDYNNVWNIYNLNGYLSNLYDIDLPDYVDRDAYYSLWNRGGGSNAGSNVGSNAGSNVNTWSGAGGSNVRGSNAGGFEDYTLAAFGNFGNFGNY